MKEVRARPLFVCGMFCAPFIGRGHRIAIGKKAHFLRSMFQKDRIEGKRDSKDEKGEDEKRKWPPLGRNQILDQREQDKNSKSDSYPSQAIGCAPFSFKPMSKDHGERSDA